MVNIAVLVSGGGTNLQALIDAQKAGKLKSGRIALVVSSKAEAYALDAREGRGDRHRGAVKTKSSRALYGEALIALLQAHEIDMIVLAGFMLILHANVDPRV